MSRLDSIASSLEEWSSNPGIVASLVIGIYILYLAVKERWQDQVEADAMSEPPAPATTKPVGHSTQDFPKLDPPKDDPMTVEELAKHDGSQEGGKIYVAIKGKVFDVSSKPDMYGPGCGYHVFTGKDASRALGMSSLKPEDAVADYSTLDEKEMQVLEDWVKYFTKRYNIVGKVVESPANL